MSALERVTYAKIEEGGYEVRDNIFVTDYKLFNNLLESYKECTDEMDKEILFDSMVTVVSRITFGGRDPKLVPTSVIKRAVKNPIGVMSGNADLDARGRVKNPNTGIRAYCTHCMGGQPTLIRQCASTLCPLWAFRLGTNPLYARLVNTDSEAEVVEDYEAEEALEETTNAN